MGCTPGVVTYLHKEERNASPELLQITLLTQLPNPEGGEGESLTIAFSVGAGSPPLLDGCCASHPPGAP